MLSASRRVIGRGRTNPAPSATPAFAPCPLHILPFISGNSKVQIYRLIGCELVDRVCLDNAQMAHVDSEGRTECVTGLWSLKDRDMTPVAGRAIIMADNGGGADTTPIIPLQTWAACLRPFRPAIVPELVTLQPVAPGELGGVIVSATRIGGLCLAWTGQF